MPWAWNLQKQSINNNTGEPNIMKTLTSTVALLALIAAPAMADVVKKTGNATYTLIEAPVDAAVKTSVVYYYDGAKPDDNPPPYKFDGQWSFTWNSDTPDKVDFEGDINYGTHYTITDAGMMGGVSEQYFYDYVHRVKGTANWDAAQRVMTFKIELKDRDDGRASTVTFSKPPECKPEGHRACKAFNKTTPAYEGADIKLTFDEGLSAFKGNVTMIEYGGSGFTKSTTKVILDAEAQLTDG